MNKITFYVLTLLILGFSYNGIAQTLNQNAGWPNANWAVTGVFSPDPLAFEADPTITANFAFDDDDAGNGSDDDIAAESPVIDLTAAHSAGETWLTVTADYTYNFLADSLTLEYWDVDAGVWVTWELFVETVDQPTDNFCAGTRDSFTSIVLNIAAFTGTQQSGFRYRISFLDDGGAGGAAYEWGFCFDAPTITSVMPPSCPDPTVLAVSDMTMTTANLSWNENGSAVIWDVELLDVTAGDTVTGVATYTGVSNPFTATGLTNGNDYSYYVRADCGGNGVSNWVGPFDFILIAEPLNDECDNPIALTINTDFNCAVVTAGTTVGATASPQIDDVTGTPNTDVWFTFVATSIGHRIELLNVMNQGGGTATSTDMGMGVYDGTGGCLGLVFFDDSDPNTLNLTGLSIGVTYYVRVYGWFVGIQYNNFDICVGTPPTCLAPTGLSAINLSQTSADLGWTENNSATIWNIEWELAGFTQGTGTMINGTIDNPYLLSGLTNGTDYEFYVQSDCGTGDLSAWSGPFLFTTLFPPPVNDDCANAIALIPGSNYAANQVDGTVLGATNDAEPATCGSNGPGVWYSVVVPLDGNITIEIGPDAGTGDTGFDSVIEVFTGTCGTLTSIGCDDDGAASDAFSILDLTSLAAGTTIYVRVWEYGGGQTEPFSISAYNLSLSIDESAFEGFSFYPNPVKDILTLNSPKEIDNVSVYNMLGQQIINIKNDETIQDIDMSSLQSGAYFVKITINSTIETIRIVKR